MSQLIGPPIGVVVIGRNEGERLKTCLRSVSDAEAVVYVDSGSTDGSQDFARSIGIEVVELAMPPHFTAARARNAGAAALGRRVPRLGYIQFVDGDCEVQPGWLAAGAAALIADPELALVFGRRRERHPDASIYNALCDDEWNVPVGEANACGGDALVRAAAFVQVGGYPETMIAGEEPDMAMRLRARGWRLRRIDAEMTLHDAAMTRFGQWWRRTRRAGHAFAELAWRHPASQAPDWRAVCKRIVIWGAILPAVAALGVGLGVVRHPAWLLLTIACVGAAWANMMRLALRRQREGLPPKIALASGVLLVLGKVPEFLGLATFHLNRLSGRGSRLIEYKGAGAA